MAVNFPLAASFQSHDDSEKFFVVEREKKKVETDSRTHSTKVSSFLKGSSASFEALMKPKRGRIMCLAAAIEM